MVLSYDDVIREMEQHGYKVKDNILESSLVDVRDEVGDFERIAEMLETYIDDENVYKLAIVPRVRDLVFGGNELYYKSLLSAIADDNGKADHFIKRFLYWWSVHGSSIGGARSMQFSEGLNSLINYKSVEHISGVRAGEGMMQQEASGGGLRNVFKS